MRFFTTVIIGASALLAAAQDLLPTGTVSSTLFFSDATAITNVRAGQPATFNYVAPNLNSPVTITLVQGPQTQLEAREILTTSATGGVFTWTPESDLADGADYALLIQQGSEFNYGGQFALTGGSTASSIASAASTAASSAASAASSLEASLSSAISSIAATATPSGNSSTLLPTSRPTPTGSGAQTGGNSAPTTSPGGNGAGALERPAALALGALALFAFF